MKLMLGPHQGRFFLLVVMLAFNAHVSTVALTSQTQTAAIARTNKLLSTLRDAAKAVRAAQQNLEDEQRPTASSVVQDWSLMCKELCGATLDDSPCAIQCTTRATSALSPKNITSILSSEFELIICKNLCRLQSDGIGCTCNDRENLLNISEVSGNQLCEDYCLKHHETLSGCSPCEFSSTTVNEASSEQSLTSHGSVARSVGVVLTLSDTTSETPDWDEVCKALCKSGDGGSLCNCDLSPFSS